MRRAAWIVVALISAAPWSAFGEAPAATSTTSGANRRSADLAALLTDNPPIDVSMKTAILIDPLDTSAVDDRLRRLQAERARTELEMLSSTSTRSPGRAQLVVELEQIELERRFLSLPIEERRTKVQSDAARALLREQRAQSKLRTVVAAEEEAQAAKARRDALEAAGAATSRSLKAIHEREAAVSRATESLARQRRMAASGRERGSRTDADSHHRVQTLVSAAAVATEPSEVRTLFAKVSSELGVAARQLDLALVDHGSSIVTPTLPDRGAIDPPRSDEERHAQLELQTALRRFDEAVAAFVVGERTARELTLRSAYGRLLRLSDAKHKLFRALPATEQRQLVGLTETAWAQLSLEVAVLRVSARAHVSLAMIAARAWSDVLDDRERLGGALATLAKVLLIFLAAMWLSHRVPALLSALRRYEHASVKSIARLRRIDRAIYILRHFGGIALFLISVHAIEVALGSVASVPEVSIVLRVLLWLGYYRFALRIVDLLIFRAIRRRLKLDRETRKKVESSTLLAGRTVLFGGLFLSVSVPIVGHGVLYARGQQAVAIGAVFVALILLRRWRTAIVQAYLKKRPEGRLATLVRGSQDKIYAPFVVIIAFGYVSVHGIVNFGRETVLGFEQSRKALAFVFRKRLEKRAVAIGEWEGEIEALPPALTKAFTMNPVVDQSLRIDRFPGQEKFQAAYDRWIYEEARGSFLVKGPTGIGKTSWINKVLEPVEDMDAIRISVRRTGTGRKTLAEHIGPAIGVEGTMTEVEEALLTGPKKIIVLDDCHNLFLREIGGTDTLDELMRLIERTGDHLFWLCSVESLAWRYVKAARPRRMWFRQVQSLKPWSEQEITQLVMARAAASGVVHLFEDLVDDRGASASELAETSEGYTRLIWDSADGCPVVALSYWLQSLVPVDQDHVRVRLFKRPKVGRLEQLPPEALFMYAAIALHESLSEGEVARVLRFPESLCECFLRQGLEEGYLIRDQHERYMLNVLWYRPVVRFLRQMHVLEEE